MGNSGDLRSPAAKYKMAPKPRSRPRTQLIIAQPNGKLRSMHANVAYSVRPADLVALAKSSACFHSKNLWCSRFCLAKEECLLSCAACTKKRACLFSLRSDHSDLLLRSSACVLLATQQRELNIMQTMRLCFLILCHIGLSARQTLNFILLG